MDSSPGCLQLSLCACYWLLFLLSLTEGQNLESNLEIADFKGFLMENAYNFIFSIFLKHFLSKALDCKLHGMVEYK